MKKVFTEFQHKAIDSDGRDILIAAGAGSGKTGVLVERYVRLIVQSRDETLPPEQRATVESILVITFTEKATREMKSRIVEELNLRGLIEERRKIETAYISTIHGFCSRLLQENPFEAGVDPKFTVLDESQSKRLQRQIFDEVIATAYENNNREIIELVAAVQSGRESGFEGGDPMHNLSDTSAALIGKLRGAGNRREDLQRHWLLGEDQTAAVSLEPVWSLLAPILEELSSCAETLRGLQRILTGASRILCDSVLAQSAAFQLKAMPLEDTLAMLNTVGDSVEKARSRPTGTTSSELDFSLAIERIKSLCKANKQLFAPVSTGEEVSSLICHRMMGLVLLVWKAYDLAKRSRSCLDTEDLQLEAIHLLETCPGVRNRYRRLLRHLMIDEFQDTDPLQMRLVNLLHEPDPTENPPAEPNFLFIVGDVQQSIYGFRNANPALFQNLEREFREKNRGLHVPLSVNFRSRPEILALINSLFRQVWRGEATPFVALSCGSKFEAKPVPSVELLITQDLMRRDYVAIEAEALALRVRQMVQNKELSLSSKSDSRCGDPVAYRDVAILLRQLTDIQRYEEAFARHGVPYFVVGGGRGYYARPEIRDLMNVLTVLDTPMNDVALAATLRSPMVGADVDTLYRLSNMARADDNSKSASPGAKTGSSRNRLLPLYPALYRLIESPELPVEERAKLEPFVKIIDRLREQEDRLPVGHLLERLIAETCYDARILCRPGGRRRLANVRKLLQMANSDSVMGVRDFIRRLRDMQRLSEREGDAPTEEEAADVVRFYTIHGAKGLEFPVVVLADLSHTLEHTERGMFVCEPERMAFGTRLGGEPNIAYKAIDRRRTDAERRESERLLYVAMTRAREHLILCGNLGRNRGRNWGDELFKTLGILESPPQPVTQTLVGGVQATLTSLSHYINIPIAGYSSSQTVTNRQNDLLSERVAAALLNNEPIEPLFLPSN